MSDPNQLDQFTGVYIIHNSVNDKLYVGSAARGFKCRFDNHINSLKRGIHKNPILQAAWNFYGEPAFRFEPIEVCDKSECVECEQFWIDWLKPEYNVCRIAGSTIGLKKSEEEKSKLRERMVWNLIWLGRHHTKASRAKISAAQKGKKVFFTEEHRANISNALRGKKRAPFSLEWRAKLSASLRKRIITNETRKKLSDNATRLWQKRKAAA